MIEKTWEKQKNKLNIQDRKMPTTIEQLLRQYDLENKEVYKFMSALVDSINTELDKKLDR